jgi:hypothetical protein
MLKLYISTLVMLVFFIGSPSFTKAQDYPAELADMSLQELLELHIVDYRAGDMNTFHKGRWTIGYQYAYVKMEGYRTGTNKMSAADILKANPLDPDVGKFLITPSRMVQQLHLLSAMYNPSTKVGILITLPYVFQSTDHVSVVPNFGDFVISTNGISDMTIKALLVPYQDKMTTVILQGGLGLPTGSIDETGLTPASAASGLPKTVPFTMQLGSGTYDVQPGITYSGHTAFWNWGGEVSGTIRLGDNIRDYRLGHRLLSSVWLAHRLSDWFAPASSVSLRKWGKVNGNDARLPQRPDAAPVANPLLQGGTRIELALQLYIAAPSDALNSQRLAINWSIPLYQSLNGPQLETDIRVGASWQWSF